VKAKENHGKNKDRKYERRAQRGAEQEDAKREEE
jgi:hypothetical protein